MRAPGLPRAPRLLAGLALLAGLGLAALLGGCGEAEISGPPRNLVLISLDTTRRDHLPTYGYARATALGIDRLAREGAVFENAYAQDTNTNPSHTSMFTGLYPHVHGSQANGQPLAPGRTTLAAILQEGGFRTGAFVSGFTMRNAVSGLERGFEVYEDYFQGKRRDGRITTSFALRWVDRLEPGERFFLFLHLFDPHGPYVPSGRYATLFRSPRGERLKRIPSYQAVVDARGRVLADLNAYVDRYDALIRYVDDCVAELLEKIDLDRTVVVVIADHGETLGERYQALDHGAQVFDEQTRIPLIVRSPGLRPRRIEAPVETIDLLPTVLELLDVPLPEGLPLQGRSLVGLLRGESTEGRELVFSSARAVSDRHADRGYALDPRRRIHAVRSMRWKLVRYPGLEHDYLELYDLAADSGERSNVASVHPAVRDAHLATLQRWLAAGTETAPTPELDPKVLEQLRQLGYVD